MDPEPRARGAGTIPREERAGGANGHRRDDCNAHYLHVRVPYGVYGAVYTLIISRESTEATLEDTKTTIIAFAYGVLYVLIAAVCVAGDPVLRLVWVVGSLFLIFFAMRAVDYLTAARFGHLVVIIIPVWDREISAEQKVVQTLWAVFTVSFASIITAVIEVIYLRLFPLDNLTGALVERLTQVASLLRSLANGVESPEAMRQVVRLAVLGTSRMRRDLIRSGHSTETADQMGAVVALVGRLVDLAANAGELSEPLPKTVCPRTEDLAGRVDALAATLLTGTTPPNPDRIEELDLCHDDPLVREMEETVNLIIEALNRSGFPGCYLGPERPKAKNRLLAAGGKLDSSTADSETLSTIARGHFDEQFSVANSRAFPSLRSFVALCSRLDSLLESLENEIANSH